MSITILFKIVSSVLTYIHITTFFVSPPYSSLYIKVRAYRRRLGARDALLLLLSPLQSPFTVTDLLMPILDRQLHLFDFSLNIVYTMHSSKKTSSAKRRRSVSRSPSPRESTSSSSAGWVESTRKKRSASGDGHYQRTQRSIPAFLNKLYR